MKTDLRHYRLMGRESELQAAPDHWWTIRCIKGNAAAVVGIVKAHDTETAIKVAMKKFQISGEVPLRLVAQRRTRVQRLLFGAHRKERGGAVSLSLD
jgi:hypothetical protein